MQGYLLKGVFWSPCGLNKARSDNSNTRSSRPRRPPYCCGQIPQQSPEARHNFGATGRELSLGRPGRRLGMTSEYGPWPHWQAIYYPMNAQRRSHQRINKQTSQPVPSSQRRSAGCQLLRWITHPDFLGSLVDRQGRLRGFLVPHQPVQVPRTPKISRSRRLHCDAIGWTAQGLARVDHVSFSCSFVGCSSRTRFY
jgi:hypothetical protein